MIILSLKKLPKGLINPHMRHLNDYTGGLLHSNCYVWPLDELLKPTSQRRLNTLCCIMVYIDQCTANGSHSCRYMDTNIIFIFWNINPCILNSIPNINLIGREHHVEWSHGKVPTTSMKGNLIITMVSSWNLILLQNVNRWTPRFSKPTPSQTISNSFQLFGTWICAKWVWVAISH